MTIKLKVKSNQEAFDAVVRHLGTQKVRAVGPGGNCKYRTPEGLQCAIGALLDCEPERALGIYGGIYTLSTTGVDARPIDIGDLDVELLQDLQVAHDIQGHWDESGFNGWEALDETARRYQLDPAVLEAYAS